MAGDPLLAKTWGWSEGPLPNPPGSGDPGRNGQSLGGARIGPQLRSWPSQLTRAQVAGDFFLEFDSAVTSPEGLVGYVHVRDGNLAGQSFRYETILQGSPNSEVRLFSPLPGSVAIGDSIWLFLRGNAPLLDDVAADAAAGAVKHCGFYPVGGGETWSNSRIYFVNEEPGPMLHELALADDPAHVLSVIQNKYLEPDLTGMRLGGGSGFWSAPLDFPTGQVFSGGFNAGSAYGLWIRRTIPPGTLPQTSDFVRLRIEDPTTGGGRSTEVVIGWDGEGFTPVLDCRVSPTVYLGGGGQVVGRLKALEGDVPIAGQEINLSQTAGPALLHPQLNVLTDERGEVQARYEAPTDPGEIGETLTFEADY